MQRCNIADKQQELDLPSLRVDDSEAAVKTSGRKAAASAAASAASATAASAASAAAAAAAGGGGSGAGGGGSTSGTHVGRAMSHISGVKRPLSHSNSLTSEKVPKYGVDTCNEHELGKVSLTVH